MAQYHWMNGVESRGVSGTSSPKKLEPQLQHPKSWESKFSIGTVSLKKAAGDGQSAALARRRSEQKERTSCQRCAARASWNRKKSIFAWRYSAECLGGGQVGCPARPKRALAKRGIAASRRPDLAFAMVVISLGSSGCVGFLASAQKPLVWQVEQQ